MSIFRWKDRHRTRFLLCGIIALGCFFVCPGGCRADVCGYANPQYSEYNRLLRVDVMRGQQKVGEVLYSFQLDGYYVRCTTGGVPRNRFFGRARDARWAACDGCY